MHSISYWALKKTPGTVSLSNTNTSGIIVDLPPNEGMNFAKEFDRKSCLQSFLDLVGRGRRVGREFHIICNDQDDDEIGSYM